MCHNYDSLEGTSTDAEGGEARHEPRAAGGGGGKGKDTKKDWARAARGAARSPYDGGPRLESNEPSLYGESDDES